jgi:hypothetical protein
VQPLTAPPRQAFTAAQVTALLTAPDLSVDFGADLLDASLNVIDDLTPDLVSGVVHRVNGADIHGTCELTISRELAWGRDRVRPYMLLSSATAGVSGVRFNLGVFLLTTPDTALGETPQSYTVTGFDQLHLLQANTGASVSAVADYRVLDVVRATMTAIEQGNITAPILFDSAGEDKVLATYMSWWQTSSESPTWLGICNDLLASIGYRGLWVDQDGAFRSGPYVLPELRASEFNLNVGSLLTGIVAQDRTVSNDVWGAPNRWRFVRNDMSVAPVETAGIYTTSNPDTGPSSIASLGRVVPAPVVYLDATSQADLVTQGDRIKAAAMRTTEVLTLKTSPFPAAWHVDRVTYADAALGATREAQCRSWSLPLDGSDGTYVIESL